MQDTPLSKPSRRGLCPLFPCALVRSVGLFACSILLGAALKSTLDSLLTLEYTASNPRAQMSVALYSFLSVLSFASAAFLSWKYRSLATRIFILVSTVVLGVVFGLLFMLIA